MERGTELERYVVEEHLGSGGMGVVYRVRHKVLGSTHAIKVLHKASPMLSERLLREAKAQASLGHPNILPVTDFLQVDGVSAIVMEYVSGGLTLDQLLVIRTLTIDEIDTLGRGIISGVMAAHREGLLHRDLKPNNVLILDLEEGLVPKIADFGLVRHLNEDPVARLTKSGISMGTPGYAAPEQIRGSRTLDERADLFGLGATLYELVTGYPAFPARDLIDRINKVCAGDYVPVQTERADAPARLVAAIDAALVPDRAARVASCSELFAIWTGREGPPRTPRVTTGTHPSLDRLLEGDAVAQAHLVDCARCRIELRRYRRDFSEQAGPTAEGAPVVAAEADTASEGNARKPRWHYALFAVVLLVLFLGVLRWMAVPPGVLYVGTYETSGPPVCSSGAISVYLDDARVVVFADAHSGLQTRLAGTVSADGAIRAQVLTKGRETVGITGQVVTGDRLEGVVDDGVYDCHGTWEAERAE